MSEETAVVETLENPVALDAIEVTQAPVEVAPAVEPPEQTYEYQPTDDVGRALGGRQVIKYRSHDELRDKLTQQNILLVRKLRETTRKQRLGIGEDEQIPDSAPRFDNPIDFSPRQLSDDERVTLSRNLLDPDKLDEAKDMFFESTLGVKPETLRNTLTQMQTNNLRLLAKAESDAFVQANQTYYKCQDNFEVITNWMLRKDLAPVRENFQLAYNTLKAAGLLLEAPIVREEAPIAPPIEVATPSQPDLEDAVVEPTPANAQPVQVTPSRITTEEPAQPKRAVSRVPSGLTRDQAGDAGTTPKSGYTLRDINAMSSEVYKQKFYREKGFKETVERLEKEAQDKRVNRAR